MIKLKHFLGEFKDMAAVQAAFPGGGNEGDYLVVDGVIKGWDIESNTWADPIKKDVAPVRATEQVFGDLDVHHNIRVGGNLSAKLIRGRNAFLGLFADEISMRLHFPTPALGEWAMVLAYYTRPDGTRESEEHRRDINDIMVGYIFVRDDETGEWKNSGYEGGFGSNMFEAVEAEKERAQTAEGTLQDNIDTEAATRESADETLQGNIDTEAATRESADETLQGNIDTEASTRESADETLQGNIDTEASTRESADETLQGNIDAEATARQQADTTLQGNIDAEAARAGRVEGELGNDIETINSMIPSAATSGNKLTDKAYVDAQIGGERTRAMAAEETLQGNVTTLGSSLATEVARATSEEADLKNRVEDIEDVIPTQASEQNQLADKNFVNSSIATATATHRGSFNLVTDLELSVNATREEIAARLEREIAIADNNDYVFVQIPNTDTVPSEILRVERYKYNGAAWGFEYELNNSSFTAAQWAALNSGITSGLIASFAIKDTNAVAGHIAVFDNQGNPIDGGTLPGIDEEPTPDSENLVSSGGVAAVSGYYIENPEFVQVKLDAEGKILEAIREDGTKILAAGAEIYGKTRMYGEIETNGSVETVIDNPEFAAVWVDAENKILFAIKEDGDILYGCGIPSQIKAYIDEKIREVSPEGVLEIIDFLDDLQEGDKTLRTLLNEKVDKEEGKSLIDADYASSCSAIENPEFIEAKIDSEGKLLAGRTHDGAAFENVGIFTPKVSIDGHVVENIDDPEGRTEIKTDSEGKILSYRDSLGVKHENVGIYIEEINTLKSINGISIEKYRQQLTPKKYNLPEYGHVNMDKELVYTDGNNNYNPSQITKVGSNYYVTNTLVDGEVVPGTSVEITIQENDIDLSQWPVDKSTKHYLKVFIDFGTYLSGTFYIETKYQGNSTLNYVKKNFRFTFYKDILFSKKLKIQIGELIQASKYNLKAYWRDFTLLKEQACYRVVQAIRETREYNKQYPWNAEYNINTGATGLTLGFPIRINVSGDFQGVYWFNLAKDANNFMLDDKTMNGILVQGDGGYHDLTFWQNLDVTEWSDILADIDNGIGEDSLPAVQRFYNYVNSNNFNENTASDYIDIDNWIDCIIILQTFGLIDMLGSNMMLYAGADKQIISPMYYDMDWSWGFNCECSVSTFKSSNFPDKSIWVKIISLFKDRISKRYNELRGLIINMDYLTSLIVSMSRQIPYTDYKLEIEKYPDEPWPYFPNDQGREGTISSILEWMKNRIIFMDEYFNKIINF